MSEEYTKINHIFDNSDLLVCSYRFLPDIFLNSVLVEIEIKDRFELKSQQNANNEVFIEEVNYFKTTFQIYLSMTDFALTSTFRLSQNMSESACSE